LIAESELNRAQLVGDLAVMTAGVRTLTDRAKSFGSIASSAASSEQQLRFDSLTASAQFGYFDWDSLQYSPPPDTPAVTDLFTQQNTGTNWVRHLEHALEYNYHARGSLDWYKPALAGNHQFTVGFDYLVPTINRSRGSRGAALDYQLVFNNGVPFELNTNNFPVNPFTTSRYLGIYSQDRWAINRQLTLTLGARTIRGRRELDLLLVVEPRGNGVEA
jgi:hypothetical protein